MTTIDTAPVDEASLGAFVGQAVAGVDRAGGQLGLGTQAGERQLGIVLRKARFTRERRAAETPFNLILEARP